MRRVRRQNVRVFGLVADFFGVGIAGCGVGFALDCVLDFLGDALWVGGLAAGVWSRHFWGFFGRIGDEVGFGFGAV